MKSHTTVTITREMLRRWNACEAGLERVEALLPAKISTNPDDNYDLACDLADTDHASYGGDDSWWLCSTVGVPVDDRWAAGRTLYRDESDPMIVAQRLAMVADKIASNEGR